MQLVLKTLSGMANSIDPNQTAPSRAVLSGSVLFAYDILSATLVYEILGHLLYPFKSRWLVKKEYLVIIQRYFFLISS